MQICFLFSLSLCPYWSDFWLSHLAPHCSTKL
jgi:hypothetical protein